MRYIIPPVSRVSALRSSSSLSCPENHLQKLGCLYPQSNSFRWLRTNLPVCLTLHFPITHEQEILNLLCSGQELNPNLEESCKSATGGMGLLSSIRNTMAPPRPEPDLGGQLAREPLVTGPYTAGLGPGNRDPRPRRPVSCTLIYKML